MYNSFFGILPQITWLKLPSSRLFSTLAPVSCGSSRSCDPGLKLSTSSEVRFQQHGGQLGSHKVRASGDVLLGFRLMEVGTDWTSLLSSSQFIYCCACFLWRNNGDPHRFTGWSHFNQPIINSARKDGQRGGAAAHRSEVIETVSAVASRQEVAVMVGVVAYGSVSSIKALWETRIKKSKEEEQKRTARGGAPGR